MNSTGCAVAAFSGPICAGIETYEQAKPYEVELCVGEVAHYGRDTDPVLYRITYDGSIADEPHWVVMGGNTEPVINSLKESYAEGATLKDAVGFAVKALQAGASAGTSNGSAEGRVLGGLEVAVLEQSRPRRAFRRIKGAALEALLPEDFSPGQTEGGGDPAPEAGDSKDSDAKNAKDSKKTKDS